MATGLNFGKALLQALGRYIQGHRNACDFVSAVHLDAGREISGGNAFCKAHNPLQATGNQDRRRRGEDYRDQQGRKRAADKRFLNSFRAFFDRRQWVGKTNCAVLDWRGGVQEIDSQGLARAARLAFCALQRSHKLGPLCMILHCFGISFGIGKHLPISVDDRGARASGLTHLLDHILQGMRRVIVNAICEQTRLLLE